jgi:DNA repair exonuclease SbcCD ATPase subunit
MPYVNIPKSSMSSFFSIILGKAKAELQVKVQDKLSKLEDSVRKQCKNSKQLLTLSKNLDNLQNFINDTKNRVSKIQNITQPLGIVTNSLTIAINLVKIIPTPAAAETAGTLTTRADLLHSLKEINKQTSTIINTVNILIQGASNNVSGINELINTIDLKIKNLQNLIKQCLDKEQILEKDSDLIEPINSQDITAFTTSRGITYFFEIITVDESQIAPLRQAIAKDRIGIIRFTGQPSFSSSTSVLIDELKFVIENQT